MSDHFARFHLGPSGPRFHVRSLTLLAVLALIPMGCTNGRAAPDTSKAAPEDPPIPSSSLRVVESAEVPEWLITTGSLVAHDRADVVPNVPGKVLEVMVERGAKVAEGDPLVRLDVRDAKLDVREAKANLAGLEAAKALAETTCARSSSLHAQGAVSSADVDRDQASCRQAEQNVRAAKVRAQAASKTVADGIIRAPFSGTVAERKVSPGEWANLGATMLTLVEDGPLRAELELSEAASVHVGLGTEVEIFAIALPERTVRGKVTRIAPELDPASRTRVAEVELPEVPELVPGMFVRAKVITGKRPLPVVPRDALLERGTTWRVFVAVEGHVEERVVQLGPEFEADRVAIIRGVAAGESIVVGVNLGKLRDGQSVD
ncbi:efflux RND transporter periplasmic adaptor subunit [Nannocystaceae bacterium ST9]